MQRTLAIINFFLKVSGKERKGKRNKKKVLKIIKTENDDHFMQHEEENTYRATLSIPSTF